MVKEKTKVNKDKKQDVEVSKLKKVLNKVGAFFNHPAPLFIAFTAIIIILLVYIYRSNTVSTIYVGGINDGDLQVPSIHYFANNDMNYFYSSTAIYQGKHKDAKVYNYEIGYYAFTEGKEYVPFLTRANKLEKPAALASLIQENSTWEFGEAAGTQHIFTNDIKKSIGSLYFIVKASTDKNSDEADIVLEIPVKNEKITK